MRLLLDTHAFLWWITDDERLSARAGRLIANTRNEVLVSAVSAWEIIVKEAFGKLPLPEPAERFVPAQMRENDFSSLSLDLPHALLVSRLPSLHRDPFDRLLIAQAMSENLTLVTSDKAITRYPVKTQW